MERQSIDENSPKSEPSEYFIDPLSLFSSMTFSLIQSLREEEEERNERKGKRVFIFSFRRIENRCAIFSALRSAWWRQSLRNLSRAVRQSCTSSLC